MESNATETPDLSEFEVFDYRDIVIVISYSVMSSGQRQSQKFFVFLKIILFLTFCFISCFSWHNSKHIGSGGCTKAVISQGTVRH